MSGEALLRWPDLGVIGFNFLLLVGIGIYCSRKNVSAEAYFLANRSMPGWVVGVSLMATLISSMTSLGIPALTYVEDWRYMPAQFTYLIAVWLAVLFFMPLFRRGHVRSAYEYLELRFGTWARLYAAGVFVLFQMFRLSVILYAVCLPIETMSGISLPWIILFFGTVVATYTIVGGLEAVIWTDLIQGIALMAGGLIGLPIIIGLLPGGADQLISVAIEDGKVSVGSTAFSWSEQTLWVIILVYFSHFVQMMCTDQMTVQRYCAMKTDRDARRGLWLGGLLTVPVLACFAFIGTAIYVLYKQFPEPALANLLPEQVFPYFILTRVPAGVAGFVIAGLLSAAMSTLDSSINASAATVTNDFYRRLMASDRSEAHYLKVGRWLSAVFGVIMISLALMIHLTRSQALMDLQTLMFSIMGGGLLGLFLLGFLTCRVDSRVALIATVGTMLSVCIWVFADSETGQRLVPSLAEVLPNKFWISVLSNVFVFALAYALSLLLTGPRKKDLTDLTDWTRVQSL